MSPKLSQRLQDLVEALPLKKSMRILEIGCGPGAMARALALRVPDGYVLGIDRSAKAIAQARSGETQLQAEGRLEFAQVAIEDFVLKPGEALFDLIVAIRVGTLDGRHPESEALALQRIAAILRKGGQAFRDGGDPLLPLKLSRR